MPQADLVSYAEEEDPALEEAEAVAGEGSDSAAAVEEDAANLPPASGQLELAVTQVNYSLAGTGTDERPLIHVFGRNADDEREHVVVRGFRPYFYVPTADLEPDDLDEGAITGSDPGYESIRGEELTRIYARTPRDVGQVRDQFRHFEADVPFPNRFLIDKGIRSGIRVPERRENGRVIVHHEEVEAMEMACEPRLHMVDIEVDDRSGFPEDGEEPILCLTSHDSYRDEYVIWLFVAPAGNDDRPETLPNHEQLHPEATVDIRWFDTEEAMLDDYLAYVEETEPDIASGWNLDDFDAPYLLDRLEQLDPGTELDLSIERLSPVDEVWRDNWRGPNIKGLVVFDLLYAYRRTQFTELESYRLDAVGEAEVGVTKERYTGSIGDLWEENPERLLEYNLRDVELCVEIDRKQQVVAFWNEVRTFVGCKLEDAPTPGDTVDVYVLHKVHGEFVLPSRGQVEGEDYEGGAVFDPITGVREMVSVFDLKSLYPMCMVTINASPETKVDPDAYGGDTYVAPNGTHFRKEPDGIIREMVDELLAEREEKKAKRDDETINSASYHRFDRQQQAVKVLMNSLYGVLGWTRFRLYDREMGAAITATGRSVLEFTESSANSLGYQVVYGDTDSVMLEIGDDFNSSDIISVSKQIEADINKSYDEFADDVLNAQAHRFQIEFEKLYRRFFQAGKKKRYAGHIVWSEGKDVDDIDITGFEYQRSDIAPITKEVQHRVIEMIVTGEDLDDVNAYLTEVIQDFLEGAVELDDIGIPGGIGKRLDNYETDTAHVRGAKYANLLLGTNFKRGAKPKRYYLKGVHPSFFARAEEELDLDPRADPVYGEFKADPDVICVEYADELPEAFEIDYEKMLEKTLKGPISRVLEALDVSWEEIKSGQEQTGLGQFY